MTDEFRVFIGAAHDDGEEPDWTHVNQVMSWAAAKAFMVARFERWLDDDCAPCVAHAQEQLPALRALTPGSEWEGEVEGDDYLITRA